MNEITQQKDLLERENTELQRRLQQATQDATALLALADKMRKKDKATRVRGAKARTQLDQLHRIMNSIVKNDFFMGNNEEEADGSGDENT